MSELEVQIVTIEPMHVASFWAFGEQPEYAAFQKLEEWARPLGLLDDPENHRIFGFDNPVPHPGSPNYGYEFWLEVESDTMPSEGMKVLEFEGGLYAVTRCTVPGGRYTVITETWRKLVAWREESEYRPGRTQWLEQSIASDDPEIEFILDLHLPIAA